MNAQTPSTAVANIEPAHQRVAHLSPGSVNAIVPQTFDDVYRFAQVLSRSGLVPYGMDTPEKVSVAILTGLEIGVKPMQAVQGIAVINGAPRIWGDLALAVVRGSGQLEKFSEKLVGTPPADWPSPKDDERDYKAVCIVKRKGEDEVVKEYSIADAVVAKLWNKSGPKGPTPWVTNPKRMLAMRARAFALRDAFTDILKGMPIAEEMIGDETEDANYRPISSNNSAPPPPPSDDELNSALKVEDAVIVSESAAIAPKDAADAAGASTTAPQAADAPAAPSEDAIDPEAELSNLDEKLGFATNSDDVEAWYVETDVEAVLADFTGFVERARDIRDRHVARVSRQTDAAPAAPAADEASDDVPPPPAEDQSSAEEDMSTPEAYEALVKAKLAAAGDFNAYEEVRSWWSATRPVRHALGIKEHANIERLQNHFAARKGELEKAKG
ncbi:recombinase RecT [Bosea sp. RCC_152_1]|uniref:recombinase RecT n=1 Tax=Bosea sp. RCC_152_1 TaxID=3239228 RepID=UPI0035247CEF